MKKILPIVICISMILSACRAAGFGGSVSDAVDDEYRNYYEIFVYSFADSNGDGIGDLGGVRDKLDYIADLGCNGIWLMPVQPSPTYHKYDITDYTDIDPQYGTMGDFDNLIKSAHKRSIRVIIDFVINHTSIEHPWFTEAAEYLRSLPASDTPDPDKCPYVDYYHFSKEQQDASWYPLAGTDYYYEGSFWERMPDLNLSNAAVLSELMAVADFWIDRGVDGFRMDALMHYSETDTKGNAEILCKLYDHCREKDPDFYIVSEVWAAEQTILQYYVNGAPSLFDFPMAGAEGALVKAARGKMSAERFVIGMLEAEEKRFEANPAAINAPFLTNHDMGRVSNALSGKQEDLKMAAALLLSMNGNPFIYYGEELGMISKGNRDENKRLPMPWTEEALCNRPGLAGEGQDKVRNKDFTCFGPPDADEVIQKCEPCEKQTEDLTSLFDFYKRALSLRNRYPQIARGRSEAVADVPEAIFREWKGERIYIVYNTEEEEKTVTDAVFADKMILETLCATDPGQQATLYDDRLILPPKSVVYLKEK